MHHRFVKVVTGLAITGTLVAPAFNVSKTTLAAPSVKPCSVVQRGPEGQAPTQADSLTLTNSEISRLKAMHKTFRVSSFWQAIDNTDNLMMAGLTATWAKYGLPIKLANVASADWDAAKQTDQINTLLKTKPDAMLGILVDQQAVAPAVKNVMSSHIPLVMWDVDANGVYPTSIVTANGRLAGCRSADAMAQYLHGKGKIASLPMKIKFYPTDQRVAGFNDRIKSAYPNIHIVASDGATVFADGQQVGEGLLQRIPDLAGIFTSWQEPAMGVVAAARTLNRTHLVVTTVDLADPAALEIAKCGILKATAPQLPYDEGVAEAKIIAKTILHEKVPQYVITNTPLATHSNVLNVYKQVFHHGPSSDLRSAYVSNCAN
jgi:ribose transport system substrate-binding protein